MIDTKVLIRRWLWGIGLLAVFFILIWKLETLATLILLSLLVAYVLNPVVTKLDKLRFINRTGATAITLVGLLVGFVIVLFFIIPDVIIEIRQFVRSVPKQLENLQTVIVPWIEKTFNVTVPVSFSDALEKFGQDINNYIPKVIGPVTSFVANVFGRTLYIVLAILGAMMFPLFVFFMLKDFPRIVTAIDNLLPRAYVQEIHDIARESDASLSAFLHGQFMVMLVLGTLYSVGYSIVGIPVAIGIGLLTGLLCFIPYVGAATGFFLALFLSLLDFKGFDKILGVGIVFGSVQFLDAVLITPKILGGKLGIRPLWIIVALMAGAELFGFLGVLLAVPTTAVLKVLVKHTVEHYKKSHLYQDTGG